MAGSKRLLFDRAESLMPSLEPTSAHTGHPHSDPFGTGMFFGYKRYSHFHMIRLPYFSVNFSSE